MMLGKCEIKSQWVGTRVLQFNVTYFIGHIHFEWYSQNEVGYVVIPVLWTGCEKFYCH